MDALERPLLSEAESTVLRVLWDFGPATVRSVSEALGDRATKRWAYTTVQTLLQRLKIKGYVESEAGEGLAHRFRATASRDDLLLDRLKSLADEFCEGTSAPLVLTLVENHKFSPDEIERFRALLDRESPSNSAGERPGKTRRSIK